MGTTEGERHHREYLNLRGQTDEQLGRSIRSYERNIVEHNAKVANPSGHVTHWNTMDSRHQAGLIRKWENEINDFSAKLALAREVKRERGL